MKREHYTEVSARRLAFIESFIVESVCIRYLIASKKHASIISFIPLPNKFEIPARVISKLT